MRTGLHKEKNTLKKDQETTNLTKKKKKKKSTVEKKRNKPAVFFSFFPNRLLATGYQFTNIIIISLYSFFALLIRFGLWLRILFCLSAGQSSNRKKMGKQMC